MEVGYTRDDLAELFEWDWAYTEHGWRLHHVASFTFDAEFETSAEGVASCGLAARFAVPGFVSRMSMARCDRCCDRLAIARGIGSPKNDDALRPWVEERLSRARASHPDGPNEP